MNEKLYFYLDSEVSEEVKEEIESHLSTCQGCRATVDFLRELRGSIRRMAYFSPAPEDFKKRITSDIRTELKKVTLRRVAPLVAVGAAAILILTFIVPGFFKPHIKTTLGELTAITDSYERGTLKADFSAKDLKAAEAWLKERQFAVALPPAPDVGYNLVGVSLRAVAERLSAIGLFEDKKTKEKLAFLAFKDKKLNIDTGRKESVNGKYMYSARYGSYNFALWRNGDIINIFITQEPEAKLLKHTRVCIKQMG